MNKDRDKVLRYYKASGDELLAARLFDLAEEAAGSRKYRVSGFLDPYGATVAETVVVHFPGTRLDFDGGFAVAERAKAAFIAEDYQGKVIYDISALQVVWDKRFYTLAHRDVLGALLGLGCEREVLGDIVFNETGAQFVANTAVTGFLTSNLTHIGPATVSVSSIPLTTLAQKEERIKEIRATVAALRLDAVSAAGYGVSRSHMAEEIKAQRVKINWKEAKNAAQSVKAGDVISFRGRGRVEVSEINGLTKKGRTSIILHRYY